MDSTEVVGKQGRWRRRAGTVLAVLALAVAGVFVVQTVTAGAAESGEGESTFVPMQACRLTDTRPDYSIGPSTTFEPDATVTIQATGMNGECTIPSDAVGLSLNVTAVNASLPTYLTIWSDGPRPNASSINPRPGEVAFNAVTTTLSQTGSFLAYNHRGTVNVIIDVNGYFTDATLMEYGERVAWLEQALPVVASAEKSTPQVVDETSREILGVTADSPAGYAGRLVASYSLNVDQDQAGAVVECSVDSGYGVVSTQRWESPGLQGGTGHISGTKDVGWPGDSIFGPPSVFLSCHHSAADDPTIITNASLTMVFYPDPDTYGVYD